MKNRPKLLEDTAGAKALRAWLDPDQPEKRTQTSLAEKLGVSQAAVSQWLRGTSRPEHHLRIAIERVASIPANDWLTKSERDVAFPRTGTRG